MPVNSHKTPGVYIEEAPSGARPIQAVGTRTAGFIGRAPLDDAYRNTAVSINSWREFQLHFLTRPYPPATRYSPPAAPPSPLVPPPPGTHLSHAVYGFFLNGGSRCYVVNTGSQSDLSSGLNELAKIDEIAIVAAPGFTNKAAYDSIRDHCDLLRDRVGILDGPAELGDEELRLLGGEQAGGTTWRMPDPSQFGNLALYVPWLTVSNPDGGPNAVPPTISVPPSGHIAGIWARTDAARGVHKAPANETVLGALGLQRSITSQEQGPLNTNGVNCLRNFPGQGILVWGARTLSDDSDFRYVNVRRLANMLVESIAEGTRWAVFEPNDQPLWQAIRRDISNFLLDFWRDGALMGSTPEKAFFVRCDETTNTTQSINEGQVVILIGFAPLRPAEFIIISIIQSASGPAVQV
jgi:uncharacterized protein